MSAKNKKTTKIVGRRAVKRAYARSGGSKASKCSERSEAPLAHRESRSERREVPLARSNVRSSERSEVRPERTSNDQEPILVIIGPTASGKTGLSIRVAQELTRRRAGLLRPDGLRERVLLDGTRKRGFDIEAGDFAAEIISADSRAIYIDMNIGTAKPDMEERAGVPHYGFDLVEPNDRFTVYEFQQYARERIDKISAQGRLPIIAGGTGLYVDALIYDYDFSDKSKKTYANRQKMNSKYLVVGIDWSREVLRQRISERANKFFEQPIEEECLKLVEKYGWDSGAMTSNIYPIIWDMMNGKISREEAIRLFELDDWHLAKRQLTWFKRNKNIVWLPLEKAEQWILDFYKRWD